MKPTELQTSLARTSSPTPPSPNALLTIAPAPRSIFRSVRVDQSPSVLARNISPVEPHQAQPPAKSEDLMNAILASLDEAVADQEETLAYRLWAAWRITCELGRHLSEAVSTTSPAVEPDETALWLVQEEDMPLAAVEARMSPWTMPRQAVRLDANRARFGGKPSIRRPIWATVGQMSELACNPEAVPIEKRAWTLHEGKAIYWPGIALQPPPLPREFAHVDVDGSVDLDPRIAAITPAEGGYDPYRDDPNLLIWMEAARFIAEQLRIDEGTPHEPRAGVRARSLLASPLTVRQMWPSPADLIEFEESLVDATSHMMARRSNEGVQRTLSELWGLQSWESARLMGLVNQRLARRSREDAEVSKGRIIARLEKVAEAAGDALDVRTELMAIKTLAVVQGVARMEPEDDASSFRNIIKASAPPSKAPQDMPKLPEA